VSILALAAFFAAGAAPAPYPEAEVLNAFGEACGGIDSLKKTAKGAVASGWETFTPDASSPIGQLLEYGYSEGKKIIEEEGRGSISPMLSLRREVAGEQLVLVLSGVELDGTIVNGCRVYDVGEERELSVGAGEKWVGRAPSHLVRDDLLSTATWEPGYGKGHNSFEIYFIPPRSPAIEFVKFSGVALKADFVGAKK
jgi:hypothetical protein